MIKSDDVRLRAVEPHDIDVFYEWENDMSLWQVSNTLSPFSRVQLQKYVKAAALDVFQTKQLRLVIEACDESGLFLPVGMIDLFDFDPYHNRGGVGIMVNEKWRNKKVASSALKMFIDYVFGHLGLHQLYCNISVQNFASITLFEKAGFKFVGTKRDWLKINGAFVDENMYQLIVGEKN